MQQLFGVRKHHDWGSPVLIPSFLGEPDSVEPLAELWFGAHPQGSSGTGDADLQKLIDSDPPCHLGKETQSMFGDRLPYLVKLIAPTSPLSIQVHPSPPRAAQGFAEENGRGIPLDAPWRSFRDSIHKPEMVLALTEFDGLVGFAVRRRIRQRLDGLDCRVATRLSRRLLLSAGRGVRPVVAWILDPDGPSTTEIDDFVTACEARLLTGTSPEPLIDQTIVDLNARFGPDPALLIAFLMNHLRLSPGEAAFLSTGTVHSYQRGLALEVMANSDNVVRAGLTTKHVDPSLFLDLAMFDGAPPTRIAPEHPVSGVDHFRSPVEDFELITVCPSTQHLADAVLLPGSGPRIVICVDQSVDVNAGQEQLHLTRGQAAFVSDADGPLCVRGDGTAAVCQIP